jgi:putative transferase (TIGR04331 family)
MDNSDKKEYFLATTALEEFWDTSKPMIFLGEWCKKHSRMAAWQPLSAKTIGTVFDNTENIIKAYEYVNGVFEQLLPGLTESLNYLHNQKHSQRYWRIVIGPWLFYYIDVIYDRYVALRSAIRQYQQFSTIVLSEGSFITPLDSIGFIALEQDDPYNLQIFSRLIKELFPDNNFPAKQLEIKSEKPSYAKPKTGFLTDIKKAVKSPVNYFIRRIRKNDDLVLFRSTHFSSQAEKQLFYKTGFRILLGNDNPIELKDLPLDKDKRSNLAKPTAGKDEFVVILQQLLPLDIPKCFIEGYDDIKQEAISLPAVKTICSSDRWYFDEIFKQWAAYSSENGARLIGLQHGGNYGSHAFVQQEDFEIKITDKYYSWGWEKSGFNGKISPFYATKLTGRKTLGADNNKTGILLVTSGVLRYLYKLQILNNYSAQAYLDYQYRFISALLPDLRKQAVIRLSENDPGYECAKIWEDRFPGIKLEYYTDRAFLESLRNCRLCVDDHLSTTFIESLAANKPTVLFWDPQLNKLRAEAEPYYAGLRQAGLLYDTPESAACAVNSIYNDVEGWWNESRRQDAVGEFCQRFARSSPTAIDQWARELVLLSKGAN